jgi:glycosyltransferase involved in cell wall biosynthesis
MAQALLQLAVLQPPEQRAAQAETAAARFDFAAYAAELLAELRPEAPRVSVVVPSHNYGRFLPERLGSIFSQTHPVEEVIVLDDASTDDSVAVAEATAQDWRREIRLEMAPSNGGNVFLQWQRAAALARGSHLWIAEADDAAHPELLARLSRLLATHPDLDLVFCDSRAIDAVGETVMLDYKDYYRSSNLSVLLEDGVFEAADFLRDCLSERNTILNASAVLFRTEALRQTMARCSSELPGWRVAGDWRIYVDLISHSQGKVGYLARPLNHHRRHGASATATLPAPEALAEVCRMHSVVNTALPIDPLLLARQAVYRRRLRKQMASA